MVLYSRQEDFLETRLVTGNAEFESTILRWREHALDYVLRAVLAIGAAPVVFVFLVAPNTLPSELRLFGLVIYIALVATTLARRLPHAVRCWGALLVVFAFAGVLLVVRGSEGTGRLLLVVLPIHAAVLVGARSGAVAATISVTFYVAAAWLNASGLTRPLVFARGGVLEPPIWIFQGVMLVAVLGPVTLLLTRFIGVLQGALAAEREATARIVAVDAERRRLQRVLLETGERERRAVGNQIHDGPCQQITAALLRCKVAQNALTARGSPDEAAHLDAIAAMLDASVGEIHELARGLSPPEFVPGALGAALEGLAQQVRAPGTIACEVVYDRLAQPESTEVANQLFRIAQEAVSNAVRHARPARVRIELSRMDGALRLLVSDDGVGLLPETSRERMGLHIMRYRAELMGGSFSVGPAAGRGTLVTCTLPLGASDTGREPRA
jgi:signal transduction histidine kinase